MRSLPFALSDVLEPGGRIYWGYLLSALVLATGCYLAQTRRATWRGWVAACFPRQVFWRRQTLTDLGFFLINRVTFLVLFGQVFLIGSELEALCSRQLATWTGAQNWGWSLGKWGPWFVTIAAFVAADLGIFVAHWLQHHVPALWEFHKVHHSAEVLTPLTAYRMHPVDDLATALFSGGLSGLTFGAGNWLFSSTPEPITIAGVTATVFIFYLAGYNLRHSHVWLHVPYFSWLWISPAQHQIHHSCRPEHLNKNFSFALSIWDRVAGTLYVPTHQEPLQLGLEGTEGQAYSSIAKLYWLPFAKTWQRISYRAQRKDRAANAAD